MALDYTTDNERSDEEEDRMDEGSFHWAWEDDPGIEQRREEIKQEISEIGAMIKDLEELDAQKSTPETKEQIRAGKTILAKLEALLKTPENDDEIDKELANQVVYKRGVSKVMADVHQSIKEDEAKAKAAAEAKLKPEIPKHIKSVRQLRRDLKEVKDDHPHPVLTRMVASKEGLNNFAYFIVSNEINYPIKGGGNREYAINKLTKNMQAKLMPSRKWVVKGPVLERAYYKWLEENPRKSAS